MKTLDYCAKRCLLCDEVSNPQPLSYYLDVYEDPKDRILFETRGFVAMPDINPIVPGHTLLFPKRHVLSLAQMQPAEWEEFKHIKNALVEYFQRTTDHFFVFEHGTVVPEISSGVCVQHAHLHAIPVEIADIGSRLKQYILEPVTIESIDMEMAVRNISESYIYYEDSRGEGCAIRLKQSIPQQFVRKLVADALELADWDWKAIALPYLL